MHRSKDSGTTENFTNFLDAQAKDVWTYGAGQGVEGAGRPGRPGLVRPGPVGHEHRRRDQLRRRSDADKNGLTRPSWTAARARSEPNADTVGKAIATAKVSGGAQDVVLKIDYGLKEAGAYPVILATYEITCTKGLTADQAKFVKSLPRPTPPATPVRAS